MSHRLTQIETDMETLIPLRVGAEMLGLDPSTLRKRAAGTADLTLIRQGVRKLFVVRGEIIAYRRKLIENARHRNNHLRLIQR